MKFISDLTKSSEGNSIFEWAYNVIRHNEILKKNLNVLGSTLLSVGLICFCLGFYFKMYVGLSFPGFCLMAISALIADY